MTKKSLVTLSGVLVLAALTASATAPNAHALRTYRLKGKPAMLARPYSTQGWGSWSGNTLRFGGGEFGVAPRYAKQLQTVCATKRLFKFIGQYYERPWHLDFTSRECIRLRRGNHPLFAEYDYGAGAAAAYHVDLVVSWYLRRGRLVAKARYDFDSTSDYQCMNASCYTFYGYLNVAAISMSGGY
jgi:hypothetical protein